MSSDSAFFADKGQVAKSFGAAASQYEKVAVLQKRVAERLLERLNIIKIDPERIVDMGAGTGWLASGLQKNYRRAKIIQLDIALEMLQYSRAKTFRLFNKPAFLCADAEHLPLAEDSADMLCSSLMLQWCHDVDAVFSNAARTLRPNSLFLFSSLGPGTLMELRHSWAAADGSNVHVNSFVDMHDLGDALVRAGFEQPVMEAEVFTLTYAKVYALMRELKQLGAHNVNRGRRRSLTGKGRLRKMQSAYEAWRTEGRLPATFEVVYGHAWTPAMQTAKAIDKETAVFPVSALKRTPAAAR